MFEIELFVQLLKPPPEQLLSYKEIQNLVLETDENMAAQTLEEKVINADYHSYEKLLYTNIELTLDSHVYIIQYFFENNKFILLKKLIDIMETKYAQKYHTSETSCEWVILKKISMLSSFYNEKLQLNEYIWKAIISVCVNLQANLHYLEPYLTHNPQEINKFFIAAVENNNLEVLKQLIYVVTNNVSIYKFAKENGCTYIDATLLINTAAVYKKNLNMLQQLIKLRYPDKIIPGETYLRHVVQTDDYMLIKQFIGNNAVDWERIIRYNKFIGKKIPIINSCILQKFSNATFTIISYGGSNPEPSLEKFKYPLFNTLPPIFWAVYNKDCTLIDTLLVLHGHKYSFEYIQQHIQHKNFHCDDNTKKMLTLKLSNPVSLQNIALVHGAKLLTSQMNTDINFDIKDLKERLSCFLYPKWVNNINTIKDLFSLETITRNKKQETRNKK